METLKLINLIADNKTAKASELTYDILYTNSSSALADKKIEIAQSLFNKN